MWLKLWCFAESERFFLLRKCFLCNTDVLFKALEFPPLKIRWVNWIFKENNYTLNLALLKEHTRTAIMLFISVLKFSWSLSCEDIMNWRTVVPELTQTRSSKEWESAQRWKNVPTCLLSLVFRIWKVIFKICIDHYL